MMARIYVCGRTCIESAERYVDESAFPGRQGRIAWTYLVAERHRTVTREQLIDAIWGQDAPPASERALSAILSKLRVVLEKTRVSNCALRSSGAHVQLALPSGAWIDMEASFAAIERAQRYLREQVPQQAYGWALAAYMIAREEILPGEERPWLLRKRSEMATVLMQSIDMLIEIYNATANADLALKFAQEAIARDPLRETAYRRLMRLHEAAGNNASAVSTYQRCCEMLASELNVSPSPETNAVYHQLLERNIRGTD